MKKTKLRWYKAHHNISFNKIARAINALSYSDENPVGFDLIETSKSRLSARYIEKQFISEQIQDPFGDVEEVTSIKYTIFTFNIIQVHKGVAIIKVLSPPQSLKRFVKLLSDICDNGFAISRIEFEIEGIYDAIINNPSVDRYYVHKLNVSSIPFSRKSKAKLELTSQENAFEELKNKYKNKQYILDKIYLKARLNGESGYLEISSSGSALCSNGFDNLIDNYVTSLI